MPKGPTQEPAKTSILVLGLDWPPETFIERLLLGLAGQGLRVTVASPSRIPVEGLTRRNVRRVHGLAGSQSRPAQLLSALSLTFRAFLHRPAKAWQLAGILKGQRARFLTTSWGMCAAALITRPDVIYFPWNSAAVTGLPVFELGIPTVISCRGSQIQVANHNERRKSFVRDVRNTLACASHVHCVSESIRQAIGLWASIENTQRSFTLQWTLSSSPRKRRVRHPNSQWPWLAH